MQSLTYGIADMRVMEMLFFTILMNDVLNCRTNKGGGFL